MSNSHQTTNRALVRFLLLPTIFLTVALLGGLRVASETRALVFIAPPLVTLILALLLTLLAVRGRLVVLRSWLNSNHPPLVNLAHALTLASLFFASAQAFNSVLPEQPFFYGLFSFFFLWTLWNNQFSNFDARHTVRSLVVLFGTAFALKHLLLSSLYSADGGFFRKLAGVVLEGITLGAIDRQPTAPATGYISFFTLALYILGLMLLPAEVESKEAETRRFMRSYSELPADDRLIVRQALLEEEASQSTPTPAKLLEIGQASTSEGQLAEDSTLAGKR